MRLILIDTDIQKRRNFDPVCLSRPIWELRCGITSLKEKLLAKLNIDDVACFVPDYMCEVYRQEADIPVNDAAKLRGDDLLIVHPRCIADALDIEPTGSAKIALDTDGAVLYARIPSDDAQNLDTQNIDAFLRSAVEKLPSETVDLPTWDYLWDLVVHNPAQIATDFARIGRSGIEGHVEQPVIIRGEEKDVYIAPGAKVHPLTVLDTEKGPIYIDRRAEIQSFSRIEGPCYIGEDTLVLGAKCRGGNSVGPVCRIGGEIEETVIQGYSNKYHEGFLGHAYLGQWVNLGAGTINSDLKNDYSPVSMVLDGKTKIDTGCTKMGSLIGDYAKTSIGTLFNTGAYVGAMSLLVAAGRPLTKFIPSFSWVLKGTVTKGAGRERTYRAAKMAMQRRSKAWTAAHEAMWDEIHKLTEPHRKNAADRAAGK